MPPNDSQPSSLSRLVQQLSKLPGIGKRSAERIAFHLLKASREEAGELAKAIVDLKQNTRPCVICSNPTEAQQCSICSDPRRDAAQVLVVEQPSDLISIESTGLYRGVYHVLMGRIAPLEGVGPGELSVEHLLDRVRGPQASTDTEPDDDADATAETPGGGGGGPIREVILGLSPSLEGDGTALYLADQLARLNVKVTRLARGLPAGASLEIVSKAVLADALSGRG